MIFFAGCVEKPGDEVPEIRILNLNIPGSISIVSGGSISFVGVGFESGDVIKFLNGSNEYAGTNERVADKFIRFHLPEETPSGDYDVYLDRGEISTKLGSTRLNIMLNVDIPDKDGATIKGVIHYNEIRIEGVMVSDGIEVTVTDEDGFYWLNSQKDRGYVFISIPSGYMPAGEGNFPDFWRPLSTAPLTPSVERHDFDLVPVDNENHVIVFSADHHIAKRNSDLNQFRAGFKTDIAEFLSTNSDKKVYSLMLGDQSWDAYWYTNGYTIADFKQEVADLGMPMFFSMGNHDNDMNYSINDAGATAESNDFNAEKAYIDAVGPTYYSMNIGKVHYVCLDDVLWRNTKSGTTYNRDYYGQITQAQLDWLQKDLALITDKNTPIILYTHIPVHTHTYGSGSIGFINGVTGRVSLTTGGSGNALVALLTEFPTVHIVSGHTHVSRPIANADMPSDRQNIYEHNTASVGGTWWWTGVTVGNNVSTDGVPGGYKVFNINGTDIEWYYKSIGHNADYQFRVYDMNKVKEYFASSDLTAYFSSSESPYKDKFTWAAENSILFNVFNWDSSFEITVKDLSTGNLCEVKQRFGIDPLHNISYDIPRFKSAGTVNFNSTLNFHTFYATTTSATSTLEVTVKDRFGKEYKQTVTRPKAFETTMK